MKLSRNETQNIEPEATPADIAMIEQNWYELLTDLLEKRDEAEARLMCGNCTHGKLEHCFCSACLELGLSVCEAEGCWCIGFEKGEA